MSEILLKHFLPTLRLGHNNNHTFFFEKSEISTYSACWLNARLIYSLLIVVQAIYIDSLNALINSTGALPWPWFVAASS